MEWNYNSDDKLQLWDQLGDDVEVYVPTVWSKDKDARALFVEAKDKESVMSLVFLNRDEAEKYRNQRTSPISFVRIKLGKLYMSFGKFFGKAYSKKFECVLSTVDIQGEFRSVEVLWSNQINS